MKEFVLKGSNNTSRILIEKGILEKAAELSIQLVAKRESGLQVCVITDSNVAKIYMENIVKDFEKLGIKTLVHIIPSGEEYKTLNTVSDIYETLADNQFGRNDMIVALGGGVTGDIAGYAAATYLRGIKYLVQIPTTLLAQVDSSVGGKCGVDLPQGKNLVGACRQPNMVIIDPLALNTLSNQIFVSGMAEVIKYGCIFEPEILDIASKENYRDQIVELIQRCVELKIKVVEEDETEEGLRRTLNFGHTLGHGVEKLGNFKDYSHGEAVAVGMIWALKMGEKTGITKAGCTERLLNIIKRLDLPTEIKYPIDKVYEAMLSDKKRQGDNIYFIYIEDFGKFQVKKTPIAELKQIMEGIR